MSCGIAGRRSATHSLEQIRNWTESRQCIDREQGLQTQVRSRGQWVPYLRLLRLIYETRNCRLQPWHDGPQPGQTIWTRAGRVERDASGGGQGGSPAQEPLRLVM